MKRSRKVVSIKARGGSGGVMTGRDGAIDFSAKAALMHNEAVNPDHHIYRVIELVGTSEESIEDAITSAISRANSTCGTCAGSRWCGPAVTSRMESCGTIR